MPVITRLEAQKKNKDRVNVYVDDGFCCGLLIDDVVRNRLAAGVQITEAELAGLQQISEESKLFNKALEYVLRSPRTELQVKQWMFKRVGAGVLCSVQDDIIMRLKKLGYINDDEYAQNFAAAKSAKYGAKMIVQKLQSKGIKRDQAQQYTAELDPDVQSELALTLAQKYMRSRETTRENHAKLYRYLLGKGFSYDIINKVVANCKDSSLQSE